MSVHMKTRIIGELTEISLLVPNSIAEKMKNALENILALTDLRHVNDQGEELYTIEEVFPDAHPGTALRGLRVREGITQKQLAERIQIKQNRVSELENGVRPISIDMAKKIGNAFGISYKVFL